MDNISAIKHAVSSSEIDALLLKESNDRFYATGFRSSDGTVLITKTEAFFFTDSRYIEAAENSISGADVRLTNGKNKIGDLLNSIISDCGIKKLGIEEESLSHGEYLRLEKELSADLVPAQKIMKDLRQVKSRSEIAAIKSAQEITERVFDDILGIIRPGVTEKELAAEIVYRLLKYGGEQMSFDPIVVTGSKGSMPHGVPGDEAVQPGGFITMDFGCVKHGYCSDMTRTVAVGSVTDEMRTVYETVLAAQIAGISAARAGVTGREIDSTARKVIEDAGYGEFFGHSFGHGIGLDVHEYPNASPGEIRPLPSGAVISAEPGIYIPGLFGVRIEDMLHITEYGCDNLTNAPKNLIIL